MNLWTNFGRKMFFFVFYAFFHRIIIKFQSKEDKLQSMEEKFRGKVWWAGKENFSFDSNIFFYFYDLIHSRKKRNIFTAFKKLLRLLLKLLRFMLLWNIFGWNLEVLFLLPASIKRKAKRTFHSKTYLNIRHHQKAS